VLKRLRASGVTREQMRAQLRSMGLDPALADTYFDAMASGSAFGAADMDFVYALQQMGLLQEGLPQDSIVMLPSDTTMPELEEPADTASEALPLFGQAFFREGSLGVDPMVMGPVDRDYVVGPGDVLTLILTGAVELAYGLTVSRDGTVVIPEVGQVFVSGLTLDQVESRLMPALQRVYSDVGRGAESLTQASVSLGRVRAVQVYVSGDVEQPGSYTISALGTVMDVLQQAGGPTQSGSFRNVQIRRRGAPAAGCAATAGTTGGGGRATWCSYRRQVRRSRSRLRCGARPSTRCCPARTWWSHSSTRVGSCRRRQCARCASSGSCTRRSASRVWTAWY